MKRELKWNMKAGRTLGEQLQEPERAKEIEARVRKLIERPNPACLQEILTTLNEDGDLTDGEWTALCYSLGWFTCSIGMADASQR